MIIRGQFIDKNNENTYWVQIGSHGEVKTIKNPEEYDPNNNSSLFFTDDPVTLESDMSDTFEHVYIRQCTINLLCNFNIYPYVVANNYTDIPVEIRKDLVANLSPNTERNDTNSLVIFTGFVIPLNFNQDYNAEYNEISISCVDKLGILEYQKVINIRNIDTTDYNTPRYFMNMILGECNFTNIIYNLEYQDINVHDFTENTKINPYIFVGDNEDDWMDCKEALEEIGKIYGCYFFQNGDTCVVENTLLYNTNNAVAITKDDYVSDDTNLSIDEAYNVIKCEVDISNADEDFLNPFDTDYITTTTSVPERIMSEFMIKGDSSDHFNIFYSACNHAYQQNSSVRFPMASPDWSTVRTWNPNEERKDFEVYDHYCQISKSDLLTFPTPSYLTDGGGTATSNALTTLNWLKNNPGKGALLNLGITKNLVDMKDNSPISIVSKDLKTSLVIQIGGHCSDSQIERDRLQYQILRNIPICSFTLNSSNNLTPTSKDAVNWLIISGDITLNPVMSKSGPTWTDPSSSDPYDQEYPRSLNTIKSCIDWWEIVRHEHNVAPWAVDWLKKRLITIDGNQMYYQNYIWQNMPEPYEDFYHYPFSQKSVTDQANMFIPKSNFDRKLMKWEGSYYKKDEASQADDLSRVPVLACEMKIGDKYLCENTDILAQYNWASPDKEALLEIYSWHTAEEAESLGINNYFTISIDPAIGDYILGQKHSVQNTAAGWGVGDGEKSGMAIPITYDTPLNGEITFRVLGPVSTEWDEVSYSKKGILWWKHWWTTHDAKPILSYTENILVEGLEFNFVQGEQSNGNNDNDLVYYSESNLTYQNDEEFDCKFCTALTTNQVKALGVDYTFNNSAILSMDDRGWYGMLNYKDVNISSSDPEKDDKAVKLEEARVAEQYNIWRKPRNIMETTIKLAYPELASYKQNYTFGYIDGIYRSTARTIDLKQASMTCTMKDFS